MLFNSYEFLFYFLPITGGVFFALSDYRLLRMAAAWLALASIFFYGYWSPPYVLLLMLSITVNFGAAQAILFCRDAFRFVVAKRVLILALIANLGALAYFKYANFFVDSLNAVMNSDLNLPRIILPIGISFFTFTQIAFLVDTYQGKVKESGFVPYVLFVTYFPHLIAGPVLHHAEMMPQFARSETYRFQLNNFVIGATFFLIGLFKKVVLADGIQPFVSPVFEADPSYALTMIEAWGGGLAYTLQLYFDFSGYSDMAIGLAKLFNIDLPLNFDSPYKSANITDFWRRWHMTLSRFLRDYLYIPMGGNRKGMHRRDANLAITMLLGGLWHGAGWTFVIWGGLHGLYLVINELWHTTRKRLFGHDLSISTVPGRAFSTLITFLFVVIAWVFFRATSLDAALPVLSGMIGLNGLILPSPWQPFLAQHIPSLESIFRFGELEVFGGMRQVFWIALLLAIVWLFPNSQTLIGKLRMKYSTIRRDERLPWFALGGIAVLIFLLSAINASHGNSEFIYFNF